MVCDHACTVSCLRTFFAERHLAMHLPGLQTGKSHRIYVLKDGEYNDVPTLGGGGGGDTAELEAHLSGVEATLPPEAAQSTVFDLSGIVTLKADQSDLNALSASSINNPGNLALASASGVLQNLEAPLPLRMTTGGATHPVQLQIGGVSQVASPATLGFTTLTNDAGLPVNPARIRTGRVALDSTSTRLHVHIAPGDDTTPTWVRTQMAVFEAGVGVGIGFPQGGSNLHVVGYVRIYGGISANHPALAPWVQTATQTNWAFRAQQPHQQYVLNDERTHPNTDNISAEGIRLDGTVSSVLTWRVEQGACASTPIDFSDGVPYSSGPTLGGTVNPLTVRWSVLKGV